MEINRDKRGRYQCTIRFDKKTVDVLEDMRIRDFSRWVNDAVLHYLCCVEEPSEEMFKLLELYEYRITRIERVLQITKVQ